MKLTKFVPRHRPKVMLLAQQLLGSDVKAPVSSSEFMDYPRFYLFNTQAKGTKDIRMHPPRRKTACLVLHRCVLGRCPGPLSTAQGKPSLTTVRRSHCHGFALPSPTLPCIDIHCLHCHTSPPLSCVCPTNSASPRKEMTQSVSSSSKSCEL